MPSSLDILTNAHVAKTELRPVVFELRSRIVETGCLDRRSAPELNLCFRKSEPVDPSFDISKQEIFVEFDLREFQPKPEGSSQHLLRLSPVPCFSKQSLVMTLPFLLFPPRDTSLNFTISWRKIGEPAVKSSPSMAIKEGSINIEEMVCQFCTYSPSSSLLDLPVADFFNSPDTPGPRRLFRVFCEVRCIIEQSGPSLARQLVDLVRSLDVFPNHVRVGILGEFERGIKWSYRRRRRGLEALIYSKRKLG